MYKRRFTIALVLLLAVCSLSFTGCSPRQLVSTRQEIEIGRDASRQIERRYPVNTDPQLNALVNGIGQHLVQYSDRQDIEYTFRILDLNEVNAVSLPGGWVYVYRGLIDATRDNPDQLAGVISHEIGHIAARHHAEMIGRQIQAGLLIGVLTRGDIQRIATIFANLQFLSWSRQQEFESDRLGILYMYRSQRYNPQGLVNFFNILLQMQGREPTEFEQIFRTHPVTSERISRAQAYLDDLRAGRAQP